MRRHIIPVLLSLAPLVASAQVARDTARIAPIVVTATRSPVSAERAPASVSVISGEQLRQEGVTTVLDALRRVPGIAVAQAGSYGGQTSLFIRGGESKFAKVLIDGVPVNDAGGAFDFSSLSTDNVERIEIVRGPASVLYGSDAMAGVVQLFTRRGEGRPRVELSGRGGGYRSYDADAALRGGSGALTYSLAGARHETDGIQLFNSQYRQNVASALIGARGDRADAQVSLRYSDNNVHFPTDGAGQVVDSNAMHRDDRIAIGLDAGVRLMSRVEARLSLASHDVHGVSTDQPDSPGDVDGYYFSTGDRSRRRSVDLRVNVELPAAMRLGVGAQVEREWQASGTESNFGPSAFTARRRTVGGYAQLLYAPVAPYTVTLGIREEHNEQFGDFFTYRAAGSAQVAPATRVRASVGTAFREPTFLENYGGAFVIGNPALTPEHAVSFDAGIEHTVAGMLTLGATAFSNSFRDLIDYKYSATAPNYFNLARTKSAGAELETRVDFANGLRADAALTYLATRVVDPGTSRTTTALFAPGARLLRRPMHTVDVGVGYHRGQATVDLRAHRVGPREDNYFAPDFTTSHVTLRPYVRTDLSAALPVFQDQARRVTLTARAENLLNAHYTDVAGWNSDFKLDDAAAVARTGYRAAGRRVMTGLRVAF